jgi:hypothetical protein
MTVAERAIRQKAEAIRYWNSPEGQAHSARVERKARQQAIARQLGYGNKK